MIQTIRAWWKRLEGAVQRIQPRQARRIVVAILGSTILLLGIAMLIFPGPALIVIPAGLAILGLEFAWAKVWLSKIGDLAQKAKDKITPHSRDERAHVQRAPY